MPWKNTSDPYLIWLSEIILQQTQVAQGWSYYEKFVRHYPTVYDLASASESDILKDWQGLGYNSRARNLHYSAKLIVNDYEGVFPNTYEKILKLKGVGPYTAAAIASFAFGLSYPVVDGNVKRVFARYFGIKDSIDLPKTHREIERIGQMMIENLDPAQFNQAIMNFGALQCVPKSPSCETCPLSESCYAFKHNLVQLLPARTKKKPRLKRYFHYFVLEKDHRMLLRQRSENDIWQNMFDFPLIENKSKRRLSNLEKEKFLKSIDIQNPKQVRMPVTFQQLLTHRHIVATFYTYQFESQSISNKPGYHLVDEKNLVNFALPKIVRLYFEEMMKRE